VTIAGALTWLSSAALAGVLAPDNCRWCDRNPDGTDDLNGFDRSARNALRWKNTSTANTLSGVFSYGLAPLVGTGIAAVVAHHDDRLNELPIDILIVAEATVITGNLTELSKYSFARERPFVHYRSPAEREAKSAAGDNLSFFSGHSAVAFSLATAAGTVASMRKHRWAPAMWIAGMTFATTGAYLRIAADRHYATDVITGALVGGGIGFGVPYLFHSPHALHLSPVTGNGQRGLMLSGTW